MSQTLDLYPYDDGENTVFTLSIDGTQLSGTFDAEDGELIIPLADPLAPGHHSIVATVVSGDDLPFGIGEFDVLQNGEVVGDGFVGGIPAETGLSVTGAIDIDFDAPSFAATSYTALDGQDVTVGGTAQVGTSVVVEGSNGPVTAVVAANGTWSADLGELSEGYYILYAYGTDSTGTSLGVSVSLTVDTPPTAPVFDTASLTSQDLGDTVVTGTAVAGDDLTITGTSADGAGVYGGTVVASDGTWTVDLGAVAAGSYTLTAEADDEVFGGSAVSTATLSVLDPVAAPVLASDTMVSLDGLPTFTGTGQAGTTIQVLEGTTVVATAIVTDAGTWSASSDLVLANGLQDLTVTATDQSGNVSAATDLTLSVQDETGDGEASAGLAAAAAAPLTIASSAGLYLAVAAGSLLDVAQGSGQVGVDNAGSGSTILVGDGSTLSYSGSNSVSILAGDGNDSVIAGAGNDTISLGAGNNDIVLGTGNSSVVSAGTDSIVAGSGSDTIELTGTNSTVYGGYGSPSLLVDDSAGTGSLIYAPSGGGVVQGSNVLTNGDAANVTTIAAFGDTTVDGGLAAVHVFAGDAAVISLTGSTAGNVLVANDGRWANGNYVTLDGSQASGGNQFWAGSGNATLIGGTGADTLVAGAGAVTMTGGTGAANDFDFFDISGSTGAAATITDFGAVAGNEIVLFGYGTAGIDAALSSATQQGSATVFALGDGTTVTLDGFQKANLTAANFLATPSV